MRRVAAIALSWAFFVLSAMAVRQLVVIDEPQLAQKLEGVVLDPNGDPIQDMTVTDRSENGVAVLRSTKTDRRGHFHFPTQHGKIVYCLRFDHPLWNPLQLTVKLDKHAPPVRHYGQAPDRGLTRWILRSEIDCSRQSS